MYMILLNRLRLSSSLPSVWSRLPCDRLNLEEIPLGRPLLLSDETRWPNVCATMHAERDWSRVGLFLLRNLIERAWKACIVVRDKRLRPGSVPMIMYD